VADCELPVAVLFWPTGRSYTGQPLAELHTVGSPPLLDEALAKLYRHGVRPARPGEFTLRAFLAGRLDLIEAEAVLGVIDAQDHQELETALKQLGGGLSGQIAEVRSDLLDLLAELEAGLDFVEEDIEFVERGDLIYRLGAAHSTISRLSAQAETRMLSTGRWRVVLAGLPNAGKSCLFNALVGEEAAIVSDVKGTTRDVLLAAVDWDGASVELIDTAGWEASPSELMRQADVLRSQQSAEADLILLCIARDATPEESTWSLQLLQEINQEGKPAIVVETKADLPEISNSSGAKPQSVGVSAITGHGLEELKAAIALRLSENSRGVRQLIGTTAARCRESLTSAAESLEHALSAATQLAGDELIAVELHQSLDHLGQILGTVFTDDILDRIFSKFCIGK
jgi:tRNA modification GTPase